MGIRKGKVPEDVKPSGAGDEEVKTAADTRLSDMEEKIGELRAGLMEREKETGSIAANATKALDLVSLIHPETLAADMQKKEAKIQAIEAKLDSNRQMMESIIKDMKDFRKTLRTFTGLEEVARMSAGMRKELANLKVTQSRMEVSASKVESMFVEIQRKYAEFAKSKDMVADMGKSLNGIEREMASIRAMSSQFSSKIELNNLRKAVEGQVKWIKGITKDSRQFRDFFQKINYLETEQKAIKASIERANANFIRFSGEFDRFSNFISVKTRELEVKWLETERIKASIYEMIEDTKKAFDGKIDAVMDVIEDFAEGAEGADRLGYGKPPVQAVQAVQAYPQYRAGRTSSLIRLRDYIWECMAKGYSIETIEKVLRNAGYREDEITAAISGLR